MKLEWIKFKQYLDKYKLDFIFDETDSYYEMSCSVGQNVVRCILKKDLEDHVDDIAEFEFYYKAKGNIYTAAQNSSFASKAFGDKKIFKRETGIQATLNQGSNSIIYVISFPWVKITGLEIIGGETLDTISMEVLDSTTGYYSGIENKLLNQFGFTVNVAKDYYQNKSEFDADLFENMQIKLTYTSISAKTIGINFHLCEVK